MTRAYENANAYVNRFLNLTFLAFKRVDANSAYYPPERNATLGIGEGSY
ncbi:MAG: hypothetical protein ACOH2V_13600 [Candidatus Saccharimonadaceae bacterium]